jgi:ABC-type polysaccharide/polyol phosphate transport system ATPase subunit
MTTPPPIQVSNLSLTYRLSRNKTGSFKEFVIKFAKRQVEYEQLVALDRVTFDVPAGEVFGVIGANGAGKSTLMKVIARVLPPTTGRVVVRGAVAPMIELGAGFNPDLTGYENVVLYGTFLGRSPQVMRSRAGEIARWADLEGFMDVPIRSYSSGMLARLGFAIASDVAPEVLVVDEVLSVGDEAFQQKSMSRMRNLIDDGASVVFVSHNLGAVGELANRVMWLDHGRVQQIGEPAAVIAAYRSAVAGS